jgi:hypothetical protein
VARTGGMTVRRTAVLEIDPEPRSANELPTLLAL